MVYPDYSESFKIAINTQMPQLSKLGEKEG
jgi:hypothetical protein